ncbi:hypothetical protein KAR10_02480, partial [bacterium]|nr:hypothetical protein [bacterium]
MKKIYQKFLFSGFCESCRFFFDPKESEQESRMNKSLLVLQPEFRFTLLEDFFTNAGYNRQSDPTAPPPIILDEPDMATWVHPGTKTRIVYTYHPAISLRVIMIEGDTAEDIATSLSKQLPILGVDDVRHLLQSSEVEAMLLGIHAADAMDAFEVIDQVAGLMEHSDELVAKEARKVFHKLLDSAAALGLGILAEWKTQHPDRSALFLIAGGPRERRQLLRWLMHDQKRSNTHIDAVLRTALEDEDWEVRVTAMLV